METVLMAHAKAWALSCIDHLKRAVGRTAADEPAQLRRPASNP